MKHLLTTDGLDVQIGVDSKGEPQHFVMGVRGVHHGLVGGDVRMGKTNLLHVLISQLALCYPPEELELYLLDFKEVEFDAYLTERLPHARAITSWTDREFGLSMLRRFHDDFGRRGGRERGSGSFSFRSLGRQLRFLPFTHEILQDFQFRLFAHQIVLFVVEGQLIDPKLLRRAESFLDKLSILLELVLGFLQFFMSQLDVAILLVDIGLVLPGDGSVVKSDVRQAWTHAHWAVREHSCHRQSLDEDAILAQILIPVQLRQVQDQFSVGNFSGGLVLLDFQLPFGGLGLAHCGLVGDIPSQEISFELLFVEGDDDLCRFPPKPARPVYFRSLGENGSDLVLKSGPFNLTAGLDGFGAFHVAALGDRDGQIGTLDQGGNLFDTIGAAEFPAQAAANRQ